MDSLLPFWFEAVIRPSSEQVLLGVHHPLRLVDEIPQASMKPSQNMFFTVFQYMSFSSDPQYHCSASLSLTPNQQLTASDFYSSPCFFYLSPPATICLYPTLTWHHLLQEAPYLPHPQPLHQPIHPSYSHQPYLLTRKFETVICLFRKL